MALAVDVWLTPNSFAISGITRRKTVKSKASSTQPTQAARKEIHWGLVGSRHHAVALCIATSLCSGVGMGRQ